MKKMVKNIENKNLNSDLWIKYALNVLWQSLINLILSHIAGITNLKIRILNHLWKILLAYQLSRATLPSL